VDRREPAGEIGWGRCQNYDVGGAGATTQQTPYRIVGIAGPQRPEHPRRVFVSGAPAGEAMDTASITPDIADSTTRKDSMRGGAGRE